MANYYATIRTNYFAVKDEDAFRALMDKVYGEDEIKIFEHPQEDGSVLFGFGCFGGISGLAGDEGDDDDGSALDCFYDELQKLIKDDDAIIITEIGSEKLRYLVAVSTVITQTEICIIDLNTLSVRQAGEALGNAKFVTQMHY